MPLDTYAHLKEEVAKFMSREGMDTTSGGIDTFIDLAESWFNRNLRVRQMVTALTPTVSNGAVTHPADWREWKQFVLATTPQKQLEVVSEQAALTFDASGVTGRPQKLIVRGAGSVIWPTPDSSGYSYRATYYAAVPALSGSQATNWLLTEYPDAYLYGTLLAGNFKIVDLPFASTIKPLFDQVISEIRSASEWAEYGGSVPTPQVAGVV